MIPRVSMKSNYARHKPEQAFGVVVAQEVMLSRSGTRYAALGDILVVA